MKKTFVGWNENFWKVDFNAKEDIIVGLIVGLRHDIK